METNKAPKTLNAKSAILPVLISVIILLIMVWRDDQLTIASLAAIQSVSILPLCVATVVLLLKDRLNMARFQIMSEGSLDLTSAFYIVLLWEFTIAVAPPLLGATTVLIFIIQKEGVPLGKALAFALLVASLDNFFFLISTPLVLWLSDGRVMPDALLISDQPDTKVSYLFWLSYAMIFGFTVFMLSAIVLMPKLINRLTMYVFKIKGLKRFEPMAIEQSHQLFEAAKHLKGKRWGFWLQLLAITFMVWFLKYSLLTIINAGFVAITFTDHLLAVGKHLIFWVTLLVSPSPGNAGTAELVYPVFYGDTLGKFTFASSLVWRLYTYYPYLLLGALLLPRWLTQKGHSKKI